MAATLVVLVVGAGAWFARPAVHRGALLLGLAVLAGLLAGAGWRLERTWNDHRYDSAGPVYAWAARVHGARIALAGSYLQYLLYGEDLSNRVQYVGRPGPHGAYSEILDCREWREALLDGRYDYVVTVPVTAGAPEPVQAGWTRTDPAAKQVLGAAGQAVFRIEGPLHPAACT